MRISIVSLLVFTYAAFGTSFDRDTATTERRGELIGALHEIHHGERLATRPAEVVEMSAYAVQGFSLISAGVLGILAHNPAVKISPATLARVRRSFDRVVLYAPATFLTSAVVGIIAGIIANVNRSNEILSDVDVRGDAGFARFLKLPIWRQLEIAERDPAFGDDLIAYAREMRAVRARFTPQKN